MSRYAKALGSLAAVALMVVGGLAVAPAAQAAPAAQTQAASALSGTWKYWWSYTDYDTCMREGKSYATVLGYDGYKCVSYPHPGYVEWKLYLLV